MCRPALSNYSPLAVETAVQEEGEVEKENEEYEDEMHVFPGHFNKSMQWLMMKWSLMSSQKDRFEKRYKATPFCCS